MRIIIITQNEPFYLASNLHYLLKSIPSHSKIVGCVLSDASPFGKKENFLQKVKKTYDTFGIRFFLHYTMKFLKSQLNKNRKLDHILEKFNVPIIKLDKSINHKESVSHIKNYQPDLLISILGNQIFKEQIFNLAPKGCLNLHTALLPKYRGLMPTFWVLKNDENHTGVSVFYVDKGIDSGPILVQEKVKIGDRTQEELIEYTKKIGMDCILRAIELIHDDSIELIENDTREMTYYTFPTKKDVKIFKEKGKLFY
jgi:methionyl-tRNA formyltransferase